MLIRATAAFGIMQRGSRLLAILVFLLSESNNAGAFTTPSSSSLSYTKSKNIKALQLARKYIVIGGNIEGINPNQEEDTYNMSKKERRRREREIGEENFKNGNYKKKKNQKATSINYDKLEDKVSMHLLYSVVFC